MMGWLKNDLPKPQIDLEKIAETPCWGICRHRVPNGWLVVARVTDSVSVTFIPDPEHKWEIESKD